MKPLNKNASLVALERKYQVLKLEEYRFHALKSVVLYKETGNDAKVLAKFMPWLLTHFDAPLLVISDRGTQF